MGDGRLLLFCAIFVVSVFACEWALFGDEFEVFDSPVWDDDGDWWDGIPILGSVVDTLQGVGQVMALFIRLSVFDVPSLSGFFSGWLRWVVVVPLWVCMTYIIVSVVWI